MRAVLLLAVGALVVACAAPAPTVTVAPSLAPSERSVVTPAPAPDPTPTATVRQVPTEAPVEPDETDDPAASPIVVDWDTAPRFPSPILVADGKRVRAIGESGCATLYFESTVRPLASIAQHDGGCSDSPVLGFGKSVRAAAGSILNVTAPKGWTLGAQVTYETDPYGPFWIIQASRLASRPAGPTPLMGIDGSGWEELARGEEITVNELEAVTPDAPGHYLVSVQVQIGQITREWRTSGRTYYYWVHVS